MSIHDQLEDVKEEVFYSGNLVAGAIFAPVNFLLWNQWIDSNAIYTTRNLAAFAATYSAAYVAGTIFSGIVRRGLSLI